MRHPLAALALLGAACVTRAAEPPAIDPATASAYVREAQALWKQDGGQFWGLSLESPLIFVDRATRRAAASHADFEGRLRPEGGVFVGEVPPTLGVANHAVNWAGLSWTMLVWPPPRDRTERAVLLMHESWHRVQARLGFPPAGPRNDHLDTQDGRLWLQLEWRALAEALRQVPTKRRAAIEDALAFRAQRRRLFKAAADEERALEMHEGLAEYTGVRLGIASEAERAAYVVAKLRQRPAAMPTFVRSFAYLSGPAYGLLLDAAVPDWRGKLTKDDDLGAVLAAALMLTPPSGDKADLEQHARRYDVEPLRAAEQKRDREIQQRLARYRAELIDGPRLTLPLQKMQISFDPNTLQPIDGAGTVYPKSRLTDAWGTLTATGGVLIDRTFTAAHVPAPADPKARPLKGKTWELHLNPGWAVAPGDRKGDFRVVKEEK